MKRKSEHAGPKRGPDDGGEREIIPGIEQQIDENLRLIYQHALEESIPEPLQALADQLHEVLSRQERRTGSGGGSPNASRRQAAFAPPTA